MRFSVQCSGLVYCFGGWPAGWVAVNIPGVGEKIMCPWPNWVGALVILPPSFLPPPPPPPVDKHIADFGGICYIMGLHEHGTNFQQQMLFLEHTGWFSTRPQPLRRE